MLRFSKKTILVIALVVIALIAIITIYFFSTDFRALRLNPFKSSRLNILVIGYDSSINGPPRADTILLASINLTTNEVGVLSIPRDTRVKIPGHGMDRINASHAYGGIDLTVKTLESFLDVPIDYYVETDFAGFARTVDAIGGVEINVEQPMHYVDKAGDLYINLPAGRQKLGGEEALQYVRYRDRLGDIGRVQRQQKFLKALVKRLLSPDIIIKLPAIYEETRRSVNTDIPMQDLTPFIRLAKDLNLNNIKTATLPGKPEYIHGASYWIPEQQEVNILVNKLIRSKEYIKNSQIRIAIYNGNGKDGVAGNLADRLQKYGFQIGSVGNADNFDYQQSVIKYYDARYQKTAQSIKELISGKITHIRDSKNEGKDNIEVIIGADYLAS